MSKGKYMNLHSMSVEDILKSHQFPQKFYVKYATKVARSVLHLTKAPEARKAIETAELWLQGKATTEECKQAAADANAAYVSYTAANAASYVSYTAAPSSSTAYYANAAYYAAAASASYAAAKDRQKELNKVILLELIDSELNELEKAILGVK